MASTSTMELPLVSDETGLQEEGSAQTFTRTSARTRNKSQRFLELEETNRAFAAAKARAAESGVEQVEKSRTVKAGKGKGKRRVKKEEVYCICKNEGDGPMIECGGCNDWYVGPAASCLYTARS